MSLEERKGWGSDVIILLKIKQIVYFKKEVMRSVSSMCI